MTHENLDLATVVREHGFRLTPQRQIILDTLCETGGHVSVADLYDRVHARFPAIDRSTVYRALGFFADIGLVAAAEVGGVQVYEIAPEPDGGHHHLICRECGHVQHIPVDAFDALSAALRETYGFAADLANVTLEGVCRACAEGDES